MSDSVSVFAAHAADYDAQRRRLVPSFELFYGTAVDMLGLRGGATLRVLDLGAGTGLLSAAVLSRYPQAELVLLDGAAEMLRHAEERLPAASITTVTGDLREELPAGPFDAIVSALAIHHLEHPDKRDLFAHIHDGLRPGGVFVNAEHVAGPTPWLDGVYRATWREACGAVGATARELADAEGRMETDRSIDVATQLQWMGAAGLQDCDCFFKHLHFAVLAGWRAQAWPDGSELRG
jgi:tRNA (cmo5U34)-methyltransferase